MSTGAAGPSRTAAAGQEAPGAEVARAFRFDRLPPGFVDDPYPVYAALRTHAPVLFFEPGRVLLTRYADVERVYKDPRRFSSDKAIEFGAKYGPGTPLHRHHTTSLVFNDPPRHSRVRRLIAGALNPRVVSAMEAGVVALVDRLLDDMEARGRADLIEDFAAAIPVEVIGNLLDVPAGERGPLRGWSLAILGALEPFPSVEALAEGHAAVVAFLDYLARLVAARRRRPGDPEIDILTRLIAGEGDEALSEAELLENCIFILNAGHETTTNLIGNALQLLIEDRAARARLLGEPALVRVAVEEVLRYESSNQLGNRLATEDVAFGEVAVPAGTQVTICIGAANRDPARFAEPERFDVARRPNPHLAFASGIHQCAGMAVARLEGRIALERFLARFPDYEPDGPPARSPRVRFRGFTAIPARVRRM